ncbi:hypothetical protein FWH30_00735 [Microgenomates group bacterium]|nr:hypothetical protein [Microgenomates group bacterium]
MGAKKNVSISETEVNYKIVETTEPVATEGEAAPAAPPKSVRSRSAKYQQSRGQIDKTRNYSLEEAIELIKKTSYSQFAGTISADGSVAEVGDKFTVVFPHATGKSIRVAIVDDALLEQIAAEKIDFDVLLTTPQYMPKLAKFARLLGPKGLMPNPKNETITTDPAKKKAELEGGKTIIKTEKKAPLIHVAIGKTSTPTPELIANLQALIKACGERLTKLSLSATMSPSIKISLKK